MTLLRGMAAATILAFTSMGSGGTIVFAQDEEPISYLGKEARDQDQRFDELMRSVADKINIGEPEAAEELALQALEHARSTRPVNSYSVADAYCGLAVSRLEQDRYAEADQDFGMFVANLENVTKKDAEALLFCKIVRFRNYSLLGRREEAISGLEALVTEPVSATPKAIEDKALAYSTLASLLADQGQFGHAEPYARQAYAQIQKSLPAEHFQVGDTRERLAQILTSLGQYGEAIPLLEANIAHRVDQLGPDHPVSLRFRSALASVLLREGRFEESLETITDVHARFVELRGPTSTFALGSGHLLARALLEAGKLEEAEAQIGNVLTEMRKKFGSSHPRTLNALVTAASVALERKRVTQLGEFVGELAARRFATLPEGHIDFAPTWFLIGDWMALSGAPQSQVIFAYKQGVNILQSVRADMTELPDEARAAFTASQLKRYEQLQDMLVSEARFAEAELVGRMIKRTEYVGFLHGGAEVSSELSLSPTPTESGWSGEYAQWLERPGLVASELRLARERGASSDELEPLLAASNEAYAQYRRQLSDWLERVSAVDDAEIRREAEALNVAQSDRLQDLVADLGDDVALAQIVALPDGVSFFLITPEAFIHRNVSIAREDLLADIFSARDAVLYGEEQDALVTLETLHSALFAPILQDLRDAGTKTLMLNLQGSIRYVPFAALYDGERFVIEEFALARFTPSAGMVIDGSNVSGQAAGFGLSDAVSGFSPLPAVERELEAVFNGEDEAGVLAGEFVLNSNFTRDRLSAELAKRRPILHIASHFEMNSGDASQSFLMLGDGSKLSLSDINLSASLRFRGVELVTLSACSTGLGGEGTGLEVEGLGTLIQNKGADSVVSTLWNVSDDATADLMIQFYRGFTQDGLTKAAALQRAQLAMIRSEKSSPFYWAPFILTGDWK